MFSHQVFWKPKKQQNKASNQNNLFKFLFLFLLVLLSFVAAGNQSVSDQNSVGVSNSRTKSVYFSQGESRFCLLSVFVVFGFVVEMNLNWIELIRIVRNWIELI